MKTSKWIRVILISIFLAIPIFNVYGHQGPHGYGPMSSSSSHWTSSSSSETSDCMFSGAGCSHPHMYSQNAVIPLFTIETIDALSENVAVGNGPYLKEYNL